MLELLDAPAFTAPAFLPDGLAAPAAIVALYYSTHGITTEPGSTPASAHFEGRLLPTFHFGRDVLTANLVGGRVPLALGEVELWNGDGVLDALLAGFAVDGRRVVVKSGAAPAGSRFAYGGAATMFDGTAQAWRRERDLVRLTLRDLTARLDIPFSSATFAGTGGTEGGADLAGKPKPQLWGSCFNISPVYLGLVDLGLGTLPTFQAHNGAIEGVSVLRERGLARTEVAGAPGVGQWVQFKASGRLQTGFDPSGPITCDAKGDKTGGVYVLSTSTIAARILRNVVGLAEAEINQSALDQLAYLEPDEIGLYVGAEPRSVRDVLDELAAGILGFFGPGRDGRFGGGVIAPPETLPAFALAEEDICEIEELPLPSFAYPPPSTVRVEAKRNWTASLDIAAGATDAERKALSSGSRYGAAFSSPVAAAYLLAQTFGPLPALFADEAAAARKAARVLELAQPGRRLIRLVTDRYRGQIDVGMTGLVSHSDLGLAAGWSGVVVKWDERPADGEVELYLYG
jgi:hypothetical protein